MSSLITFASLKFNDTVEGRLLMAALAVITTECRTDKTPDEVVNELKFLAVKIHEMNGSKCPFPTV